MQTQPSLDLPLYVRWTPDGFSLAIELRLDLVRRISEQIEAATSSNIEVGGVLVGKQTADPTPAIRVDDVRMILRRPEDGPVFMLDPKEHDRVLTTRWENKNKGRAAVGFFRTHLRPGALRPSLADRTLLSGQFGDDPYVVLLIDAREPHRSALFLGRNAALAEEPAVPEFLFNESEFSRLPEETPAFPPSPRERTGQPLMWFALAAVLIAILSVVYQHWNEIASGEHGPQLTVAGSRVLTISWNHFSRDVAKATGAKLIINDGTDAREVPIGMDELRLGAVEYQRNTANVKVTFVLTMPDETSLMQTIAWHG